MSVDATLTSKSQLTLPKAVRDHLRVRPGDKLRFVPAGRGWRIVKLDGDFGSLAGMFKGRRTEPLTDQAIDEAAAEGAARRAGL
ncbi:MAG: AbrB/MazE/SpoVT family DNA-binding domain-containing protein [Aquabacterium sp.]